MEDKRIKILESVVKNIKNDVARFDGLPFRGDIVSEYLGFLSADVATIADVVKSILEQK